MLEQELSEAKTKTAAMAREEMRRFIGLDLKGNFHQERMNCAKTHDFLLCCGKLWRLCGVSCRANEAGREYFWES